MSGPIQRLVTDPQILWHAWIAERRAYMAHPTPAGLDRCLAAFRPMFIKLAGKGWADQLDDAMALERRRCDQVLIAARARQGGQHG